jgi:polysaccharide export outer membrane protein
MTDRFDALRWVLGATGLVLLLATSTARAAQAPTVPAGSRPPAADEPSPSTVEVSSAEYVIRPGDTLQIVVWKEPELTREVTVRLDGRITVPLVGDIDAAGTSPTRLGAELGKKLTRFVATPVVTVAVAQANSSRVYVLGQVVQPGAYPMSARITVLQALALAGGFKEFAKTDRIMVIHEGVGVEQGPIYVNYKRVESGIDLGQNVPLRPGDTILVP